MEAQVVKLGGASHPAASGVHPPVAGRGKTVIDIRGLSLTYEAAVMPEGDARVAEPYVLSVEVSAGGSGGSGGSTTTATA